MTQEDKELLLKDLCSRLPYGVIVNAHYKDGDGWKNNDRKLLGVYQHDGQVYLDGVYTTIDNVKPYLRPLFSMTEEEQFQLGKLLGAASYNMLKENYSSLKELLEYVYKNHIDLFGLIPMGFAVEASEGMYNI